MGIHQRSFVLSNPTPAASLPSSATTVTSKENCMKKTLRWGVGRAGGGNGNTLAFLCVCHPHCIPHHFPVPPSTVPAPIGSRGVVYMMSDNSAPPPRLHWSWQRAQRLGKTVGNAVGWKGCRNANMFQFPTPIAKFSFLHFSFLFHAFLGKGE